MEKGAKGILSLKNTCGWLACRFLFVLVSIQLLDIKLLYMFKGFCKLELVVLF